MKTSLFFSLLLMMMASACAGGSSPQVPVAELPDPAIYALDMTEMPDVGLPWQQAYNQTTTEEGYKWSYQAYQAYQPGNLGMELESGFAVNNDVVLYEVDVSREDLPGPPEEMGDIKDISWKPGQQPQRLGDKSAVWKTTLGEMLTSAWWLEFYQDHAYVRISLLGFPDQIAPAILYGMGELISSRLPRSIDQLRSDAATMVPTKIVMTVSADPGVAMTQTPTPAGSSDDELAVSGQIMPLSYGAPAGETGMVAFVDETGNQLADGVVGSDDILANLGSGTGYEWVGWTEETEPVTITFSFEAGTEVASIGIGIHHRDGLGIFVPEGVTINGERFELAADAVPNNQREELQFTGPFSGDDIEIVLHHRGRGWILVDEIRFYPEP